jgi:hypothetical protein
MSFPSNCIKGIPNRDFLSSGGQYAATHLFYFKEEFRRDDGLTEQSINWEDDESAVEFIYQEDFTGYNALSTPAQSNFGLDVTPAEAFSQFVNDLVQNMEDPPAAVHKELSERPWDFV